MQSLESAEVTEKLSLKFLSSKGKLHRSALHTYGRPSCPLLILRYHSDSDLKINFPQLNYRLVWPFASKWPFGISDTKHFMISRIEFRNNYLEKYLFEI